MGPSAIFIFLFLFISSLLPSLVIAADDILFADFEGDTYGEWKVTGAAFGGGPARGTLPNQMPVSGYLGKGLVNSFHGGDASTGTLTSPPLKLQRRYINFLIGGGGHAGKTCMNLLLEGKTVRTATGPNTRPGGSEELDWLSWDVGDLAGKSVVFQIVDDHTGGWGHINIDHIVQSERRKQAGPAIREITIEKRFLHLPVKTGAPSRRTRFACEGKVVREFDIELSDRPDFMAFAEVGAYRGRNVTLTVEKLPEDSKALERIVASDDVPDVASIYHEKYRPQFHFTARRGWLNDPNGLIYFDSEFHLFFQHNPYGWNWGNMHWGHAVSKDLIHWKELSEGLYPRQYGDWCFSGSAFLVKKGRASFESDAMVAAFTSTGRGECLVVSRDRGRTWVEQPGNPVVKHAGRDPKVIWHAPTNRWVMAVFDEFKGKQWVAFHSSPDLKKWNFESRIEGFYECPDLFELPLLPEDRDVRKWVLYAADGKYVLGQFDGHQFKAESGKHQLWHGNFYAAQTYSNTQDGRRIQVGWGNGITFPGMPFNQQMTVPCCLTLRQTSAGLRMFAEPAKELELLRGKKQAWSGTLKPGENPLQGIRGELFDIKIEMTPGQAESFTLSLRGVPVTYNSKKQEVVCRNIRAPLPTIGGKVRLRLLVDRGSVELFGNDGQVAMSIGVIPLEANQSLELTSRGAVSVDSMEVYPINSAWQD